MHGASFQEATERALGAARSGVVLVMPRRGKEDKDCSFSLGAEGQSQSRCGGRGSAMIRGRGEVVAAAGQLQVHERREVRPRAGAGEVGLLCEPAHGDYRDYFGLRETTVRRKGYRITSSCR